MRFYIWRLDNHRRIKTISRSVKGARSKIKRQIQPTSPDYAIISKSIINNPEEVIDTEHWFEIEDD